MSFIVTGRAFIVVAGIVAFIVVAFIVVAFIAKTQPLFIVVAAPGGGIDARNAAFSAAAFSAACFSMAAFSAAAFSTGKVSSQSGHTAGPLGPLGAEGMGAGVRAGVGARSGRLCGSYLSEL